MPKRDASQIALSIVEQVTGKPLKQQPAKNPAAVALGRLGGLRGGKARAASLSKKRLSEIAKKAAKTRWAK